MVYELARVRTPGAISGPLCPEAEGMLSANLTSVHPEALCIYHILNLIRHEEASSGVFGGPERCEAVGNRLKRRVFSHERRRLCSPLVPTGRPPSSMSPSMSPGISDVLIWRLLQSFRSRGRFSIQHPPSARLTAHAPTHNSGSPGGRTIPCDSCGPMCATYLVASGAVAVIDVLFEAFNQTFSTANLPGTKST